ncbi:MAG: N-acetylmuramoyl-L-alanine amidase [Paracoccaceae bacterium]
MTGGFSGWVSDLTSLLVACVLAIILSAAPTPAQEQGLSALARLDATRSQLDDTDQGLMMELWLSQPVPYSVHLLDNPPRLVVDSRAVDWTGINLLPATTAIRDLRAGTIRPGWSRLVVELAGPLVVGSAEMQTGATDGSALLRISLNRATLADFSAAARQRPPAAWSLPESPPAAPAPKLRQTGDRPLIVVLDPGHGGIDPGAESEGMTEADIMLIFARELKDVLLRSGDLAGGVNVILTREDDVFVPLETRISVARAVGADVLLSLHADALDEGVATGSTVYTMADTASDKAAAQLAERHDRADLLSGVDLEGTDDRVASVLMEMARAETTPRTRRLADALVTSFGDAGIVMHKHPLQQASFSVLKSPDIPSVLIELGFLSSARDRERLKDPEWRARMAAGITAALRQWAVEDAAEAQLLRQ